MRLPDPKAPLLQVHPRDGREGDGLPEGSVLEGRRDHLRELRAREDDGVLLRTRLDPALQWGPDHSHRGHLAALARQRRSARRRGDGAQGHATIQGSTDIATLYNMLPGYLWMPDVAKNHDTWRDYARDETAKTGWWSNFHKYITSQMKAWYGENFDAETGELFDHFPRLSGDHSYFPTIMEMKDGGVKGCFAFGQNFAVGGPHARLTRDALRNLDWLVVLDAYEVETATAWKSDGADPKDCGTEVFFMPCALVAEKDGSFTQTQRMLQWHDKAVEPPGDARSDAWFISIWGAGSRSSTRTPKNRTTRS